ncbi:hypothetical protein M3G91_10205 [Micromonospora chalcea]|uniref:hypothetical protein n=1 Tax=Micromonospora chalcea TaxID=1874 RepID=UPI0021A869D4|nr:hypothetical protein [Micromonospora chalcea]MCT2277997.1 hypothetical protein [Micromonospora chalcea]
MSGDGQAQSRITVAQVGAELDEAREEITELRRELAEVREQLGEHAAALKPRLDRVARRRAAAAER